MFRNSHRIHTFAKTPTIQNLLKCGIVSPICPLLSSIACADVKTMSEVATQEEQHTVEAVGSKLFGILSVTLWGEDELQKGLHTVMPDTAEAPIASPSLKQLSACSHLLHTKR